MATLFSLFFNLILGLILLLFTDLYFTTIRFNEHDG